MYTHFRSSRSGRGQGSPLQRPQRGPPPLPAAAGAYGLRRDTARSGRGCDGLCVRRAPAPRPRPGHSCRAVLQSRRRPGVRLGGPSLGSWAASAGPPGMGLPRPSATLGESPPAPVRAQPSGGSWRGRAPEGVSTHAGAGLCAPSARRRAVWRLGRLAGLGPFPLSRAPPSSPLSGGHQAETWEPIQTFSRSSRVSGLSSPRMGLCVRGRGPPTVVQAQRPCPVPASHRCGLSMSFPWTLFSFVRYFAEEMGEGQRRATERGGGGAGGESQFS